MSLDPSEVDRYVENAISKAMSGYRLFVTDVSVGKKGRIRRLTRWQPR
ncbi:hypothetical protein [Paenibacillus zeisoli]|nr:hypothetical protein [Paenibacillus zeisoli]